MFHLTEHSVPGTVDLVWTGAGFGLFFVEIDPTGVGTVYYLRLDCEGKPIGEPVELLSGPGVGVVTADYDPGQGFIILWNSPGAIEGPLCSGGHLPGDAVWAARVSLEGVLDESTGPVLLENNAHRSAPSSDVVVGANGYGATIPASSTDENPGFSFRFVWLSRDLLTTQFSGLLSTSYGGDVLYVDEQYLATWVRNDDTGCDYGESEICTARFGSEGTLLAPPRSRDDDIPELTVSKAATRAAAYPGGIGLLLSFESEDETVMGGTRERLMFRSIDSPEGPIRAPIEILSGSRAGGILGAFALAWTGDAFAVLYQSVDGDGFSLRLRLIVPIP